MRDTFLIISPAPVLPLRAICPTSHFVAIEDEVVGAGAAVGHALHVVRSYQAEMGAASVIYFTGIVILVLAQLVVYMEIVWSVRGVA